MNLSIQENGGRSSSLSLVEYPNEHKIDKRLSRISSYVIILRVYVILSIPTAVIMQSSIIYKFYWFDLSIFVLSKNISCTMFVGGSCLLLCYSLFRVVMCAMISAQENDIGWSLPQLFVKVLLSNLCYLRLFAHSDVNYDLSIWVKWRVSHKKCMGSLQVFSEVHVAHLFSFL